MSVLGEREAMGVLGGICCKGDRNRAANDLSGDDGWFSLCPLF
ncbi:hypothetical protein COLO4_25257 [Corchorus olitorius]|uniref:Uncharacterized protein n=1 Tax=Corchorus olitorius TaxID=93759 RepID=A0A1R3I3U6_9ROSI|nr:hypothetical protein COLO4_25257 [Corchorus olitorius]